MTILSKKSLFLQSARVEQFPAQVQGSGADAAAEKNMGWPHGRASAFWSSRESSMLASGSTNQAPVRRMFSRMSASDIVAFNLIVNRDQLLEHAKVFGNYYGTPRTAVEDTLSQGLDVLFDIDWQAHQKVFIENLSS